MLEVKEINMSIDSETYNKYFKKEKYVNNPKDYMSDIVPKEQQIKSIELAENHVDWLLSVLRPLMIEEFKHGFRHGFEQAENFEEEEEIDK